MKTADQKYASKLIDKLKKLYPDNKVALNYNTPWELAVAVILSAQCTDKRVNEVTKTLFKKYKTIEDYSNAKLSEFEQDIKPTGFYRNKAKNVINSAKMLLNEFDGKLPNTMEEMTKLSGVGRKTANILLASIYGIKAGIAVDTHVARLSGRLGLSHNNSPEKIERDLMELVNKEYWFAITNLLIYHGRAVCTARSPKCDSCKLNDVCPSAFKFDKFTNGRKTKSH